MLLDDRTDRRAINLRIQRGPGEDIHRRSPVAPVAAGGSDNLNISGESGLTYRILETGECVGAAAGRAIRAAADVHAVARERLIGGKEGRSVKRQGLRLARRLRRG